MSDTELWNDVDTYVSTLLLGSDSGLEDAVRASDSMPHIQVSAPQGKLLQLLAKAVGARRALEVGTLGGYSAIWIARALPADGSLITLEVNEEHARVARANVKRAGLGDVVDVRVGPALAALDQLHRERVEAFDLTFIDADKPPTAEYFDWAVQLSHPGSVIVVDNVVREGKVIEEQLDDASVQGMRRFMDALSKDTRVSATVIQTVGSKGYDGFALALVL